MATSWEDFYTTSTDPVVEEEEITSAPATTDWADFYNQAPEPAPEIEEPERAPEPVVQDEVGVGRGLAAASTAALASGAVATAEGVSDIATRKARPSRHSAFGMVGSAVQHDTEQPEVPKEDKLFQGFIDEMRDVAQLERETIAQARPKSEAGAFAYDVAVAGLQMVPAVAVTMVTKSPNLGLSMMGFQSYGMAYEEALAEGKSKEEAVEAGIVNAITEVGTEKLFGVFERIGADKAFKDVLETMFREGGSEVAAEEAGLIYDMVKGEDVAVEGDSYLERVGNQLLSFGRAGAIGSVLGGGISTTTGYIPNKLKGEDTTIPTTPEEVADSVEAVKEDLPAIEPDQQKDKSPVEMPTTEETTTPIDEVDSDLSTDTPAMENVEKLITLHRGRRNIGGTKRDFGNEGRSLYYTEDEGVARTKYASSTEGKGTVDSVDFEPQNTFDVDAVDALPQEQKDELIAELEEFLESKGVQKNEDGNYDDSYLFDLLAQTGEAHFDGVPDFAHAKPLDVEFLQSKGYDNARFEFEGGERVKTRLVFGEAAQQQKQESSPETQVEELTEADLTPEEQAAFDRAQKPEAAPVEVQEEYNSGKLTYKTENGELTATESSDGKTITVDHIEVATTAQKQGEGSALYNKMIESAHRKGQTVQAVDSVTEAAMRTWESLARNGAPVQLNEVTRVENENGEVTYESVDGGPVAQSVPPVAEEIAEPTTEQEPINVHGLKNVMIDAEREARGAKPLLKTVTQEHPETVGKAQALLDSNPLAPQELVEGVLDGSKTALTVVEEAALLLEKVHLENQKELLSERAADDNLTPAERRAAQTKYAEHELTINNFEVAVRMVGTEAARVLAFRQALMKPDYSLASLESQMRALRGRGLNEKEQAFVKELSEKLAKAEEELTTLKTQREADLKRADIAAVLSGIEKELNAETKKTRKWLEGMETRADVSRARLASKRHGTAPALLDPRDLIDLANIGAAKMARGIVDFAGWVEAMKADLGDMWNEFRGHEKEIFAKSQEEVEKKTAISPEGRDYLLRKALAESEAGSELSHRTVYNLARFYVKKGLRGETAVMEAVHKDLQPFFPELTEREVRRVFVNYGKFDKPTKNEVQKEMSRINALVKLQEDINTLEEGKAVPRNDKARKDQDQVLANKKRRRDAILRQLEKTNPDLRRDRHERVNAQRLARLEQQLAELKVQEQTREFPEKGEPVPESPEVQVKKAERDALQATINEIKAAQEVQKTPAEKWNDTVTKRLERRLADLQTRKDNKEYAPKPKPIKHELSKKNRNLQLKLNKLQKEFHNEQFRYMEQQKGTASRLGTWAVRATGIMRGIQASSDLSGLGRQGFPALATFPVRSGIPTIRAAFSAAISEARANHINQSILDDPQIAEAQSWGLHISDPHAADMSKMEEEFMDNLLSKIPFVGHSMRSYMTSLNVARATYYKALADTMFDGHPSPEEGRQIVALINNATGRGMQVKPEPGHPQSVTKIENLLTGASTIFYAPRFLLSRFLFPFHMMSGFVPGRKANKAVRKAQRKTTYMTMGAIFAIKGLMTLAAMGLADDDDEISWNFNPTSTDFMRVRIKNDEGTFRLDPTLGMASGIVLATRLMTGVVTNSKGEMLPLREPNTSWWNPYEAWTGRKYREEDRADYADLVTDFLSYKFSPAVGLARMVGYGVDAVGEEDIWIPGLGEQDINPLTATVGTFAPLVAKDVYETKKVLENPALVSLMGASAFFGWAGSSFESDKDASGLPVYKAPLPYGREDEGARINFQ